MSGIVNMPDYSPYQILTPTPTASPDKMYDWQVDIGSISSPTPQQPAFAHDMMMPYHLAGRTSPDRPHPHHGMYGVSEPDHWGNLYYVPGLQVPMKQQAKHPFAKAAPAPSPPDVPKPLKSPSDRKAKTQRRVSKNAVRKRRYEQDEHRNCRGDELMPKLKSSCPPEERCILESRWNHRSKKGHDMWESIMEDYQKLFNKPSINREALQMKFKRARLRYYEWLPEDLDIIRYAFAELEKSRYDILLEKFFELGGSRNMQLTSGDIEAKVVRDMKLEEGLYTNEHKDISVRRRKKINPRARVGATARSKRSSAR